MASIHPRQIPGRWRMGYALDVHTLRSDFLGYDDLGHPVFDTQRSEMGELLYRLKYNQDLQVVPEIIEAATTQLKTWALPLDVILTVPPSKNRRVQPVVVVAQALAASLGLRFMDQAVTRTKILPELKSIFDYDERIRLLADAHAIAPGGLKGLRVLLFDDLYRSGASLNAVADLLYTQGRAADVVALTLTQTRSNR